MIKIRSESGEFLQLFHMFITRFCFETTFVIFIYGYYSAFFWQMYFDFGLVLIVASIDNNLS